VNTLEKALYWGGVVFGLLAGIGSIASAVYFKTPALAVWGGFFLAGTAVVVWSGAKAAPSGSLQPRSIKALFKQIKDGPMYVLFGLFAVAVILTIVLRSA
jgi:hypothetical protein